MRTNLVTSLELSKKMKDLGFKQESEFYWHIGNHYGKDFCELRTMYQIKQCQTCGHSEFYSAYLCGELGEMLPKEAMSRGRNDDKDKFGCDYKFYEDFDNHIYFKADTEANARAKMLCYLKENNLLGATK